MSLVIGEWKYCDHCSGSQVGSIRVDYDKHFEGQAQQMVSRSRLVDSDRATPGGNIPTLN